ncbi:hypothetical protein VTN77DRAFT_4524 [Rasamsonia byssochlamydoides]|uniref:uncharacterized protein n=1 Tax=Rasamsonia byssochlamydoides TaxID=89139 RepID=UPI0037422EDD
MYGVYYGVGSQCANEIATSIPGQDNTNYCSIFNRNDTAGQITMAPCCAPNPVQVYEGCLEWCAIPSRWFQRIDNSSSSSSSVKTRRKSLLSLFGDCLTTGGETSASDYDEILGIDLVYCNFPVYSSNANAAVQGVALPGSIKMGLLCRLLLF